MKQALVAILMVLFVAPSLVLAGSGSNAYQQSNLTSDLSGKAAHTDPQLVNPWGIAFSPGAPFWIADNNSGVSTIYDATGSKLGLVVTIPPSSGTGMGTPTGIVTNSTAQFNAYAFIFDTEDGAVVGWNGGVSGIVAAATQGAVYKGLTMVMSNGNPFLLATNFSSGAIDVFDGSFHRVSLPGTFLDPTLPSGFAPFGIRNIAGNVYVTYAKQDAAKHDPVLGKGLGYVSIFDQGGNFVKRFVSAGALNAPWGVSIAPGSGFGAFSGAVLIGNFGKGAINAYNASTGTFIAGMHNASGTALLNAGLWDMVFGAGGTGSPNTLYITVGLMNESHGLFAGINVVPVSLLPGTLKFTAPVNTTSTAKVATLTNNTASTINVTGASTSDSHFVITSNACGATLAAGASCKIKVAFKPTATGTVTGTLSVTDTGAGSPQKIKLTGSGT